MTDANPPWKPGDPIPEHPTPAQMAAIAEADRAADAAKVEEALVQARANGTEIVKVGGPQVTSEYGTNGDPKLNAII